MEIILIAFFVIAALMVIMAIRGRGGANKPQPDEPLARCDYSLKEFTLNKSEITFYKMLKENLRDDYIILSKPRIEDFISVNKDGLGKQEIFGLRNRIKSRHVDFLICDSGSRPVMAVEIDGASHNNYSRKKRDEFLDKIYKDIGLPVSHIRVGSRFDLAIKSIKDKLLLSDPKPAKEQAVN